MAIKTAISLPEPLFEELDRLAEETHTPRSQLIAKAIEGFLRHTQSRKLLDQLNQAYGDDLDAAEQETFKVMTATQHELSGDEPW